MMRHQQRYGLLSLAILVTVMLSGPSQGRCAKDVVPPKTLVFFLPDTDWPPYLIRDANFPATGILVDVFKTVVEPIGYEAVVKFLPNKRGWDMLDDGRVDVHVKAREWVSNPDNYMWTDSFLESEDVLVYPSNSSLSADPKTLQGKRIATLSGFTYPSLEPHFKWKRIERIDAPTPRVMLELVARGRVDAAVINRHVALWLIRTTPMLASKNLHVAKKPFANARYRYLFNTKKDWAPLIHQFNQNLKAMKQDGRLDAILDKYR